mmetsp:Transcript_7512/g.15075  ORF Transcript_7512/g.15075 Transcript_7512/m.15075 type:complete len:603 (-) Transcript_7512:143-1951(-)
MRLLRVIRGGVDTGAKHFRQTRWLFASQRVGSSAFLWKGRHQCSSFVSHSIPGLPDLPGLRGQLPRCQPHAPLGNCDNRDLGFGGHRGGEGGLSSSKSVKDGHQVVEPCHFSSLPLDRAGALRGDGSAISDLLQQPDTKIVLFLDGCAVVVPYEDGKMGSFCSSERPVDAEGNTALYIPAVATRKDVSLHDEDPDCIFLGIDTKDKTAVFAYNTKDVPVGFRHAFPIDVRKKGPKMCAEDASILALSSGLFTWHSNTQFCSKTGDRASEVILSGHGRRVKGKRNASRSLYPRIDPAVIVGAMHGDWFLLGRKASWKFGRYSLLAGFVEVGETLETACMREIKEESDVTLDPNSIQYHSSQPWPFPQSLMVGFTAQTRNISVAPSGFHLLSNEGQLAAKHVGVSEEEVDAFRSGLSLPAINCDQDELEDARWFHVSFLDNKLSTHSKQDLDIYSFHIPGKHALANRLIRECIQKVLRQPNLESDIPPHNIPFEADTKMKYILLRVSFTPENSDRKISKVIVRGDPRAAYHNHILTVAKNEMRQLQNSELEVLGGGRIKVCPSTRTISIFGFSSAFSQAPHEITGCILRASLPFHHIHVSYDGY